MKNSDFILRNPAYKKEFDNLNTLHKEFMKRETFRLAKSISASSNLTRNQIMLINSLLDSLLLDQVFHEVMDQGVSLRK